MKVLCSWLQTPAPQPAIRAVNAGRPRAQRTYNVTAMTFTPADLAAAIREHIPAFDVRYLPNFREGIARSWPVSIDDSCARRDWGWQPSYDLQARPRSSALSVALASRAQRGDMHAQRVYDHSERGRRAVCDVSSNDDGQCCNAVCVCRLCMCRRRRRRC